MTWQHGGTKHWDAAMAAALERDGDKVRICQARSRDRWGRWHLVCGYPLDPVLLDPANYEWPGYGAQRGVPPDVHPWCSRFEAPPQERQRYVRERGRELALVKAAERRRMTGAA